MNPGCIMSSPLLMQPGFIALQLLPLLAWGGSALLRRRREFLLRNPRHVRRLKVHRHVMRGLASLREHAAAQRADAFYAELHHLLQEQLGEKLNLPASAISSEIVEHRLRGSLAHPDLVESVERLFRHCDLARYALQATGDDLTTVLSQAETTLKQLQSLSLSHAD